MTETSENKEKTKDNEIDLLDLFRKIWAGRKTIIKSMIIFFIIGVFVVLFSPKEYKSEVKLVIETSSSSSGVSGLLQQLGGISGISLSKEEEDAFSPKLYPEIVQSIPFLLELVKQKVKETKFDSTLTIEEYLSRHSRSSMTSLILGNILGLPGKILGCIRGNKTAAEFQIPKVDSTSATDSASGPIILSIEQSGLLTDLASRIVAKPSSENKDILLISVEMQDPLVASQIASMVVKSLTRYIIDYRTKKAKNDLKFICARTLEAESKYFEAQQNLATYKDRNKNVILSSVLAKEEQLQSEYDLAFDLYGTLAKQREQSKIKVQEVTPIFKVMDPAQVPLSKTKPKSNLILVGFVFLGGFIGIGIIFGKSYIKKLKKELVEKKPNVKLS